MTFDPQVSAYLIAALPAITAFVAGIIRQDRLPALANEVISDALGIGVAVFQAWQGGQLGGSPTSDFVIVASYTLVVMHTPVFQSFQRQIQTNVLSIGGKAPPSQPQPPPMPSSATAPFDVPSLALAIVRNIDIGNLVALLRDEMIKSSRQAQATMSAPTAPQVQAVRTNTPPMQQTPPSASAAWMNSGPGVAMPPTPPPTQNVWQQLQQSVPQQQPQNHGG